MKAWLLSVAATVLMTVLLELLLSEGTVKKYLQGFVRLLLLFVIITPVIKLVKGDYRFDLGTTTLAEKVSVNSYSLLRIRFDFLEKKITKEIFDEIDSEPVVRIMDADINGETVVAYVEINIDPSVIKEDTDNILLKEKILGVVNKYIDIAEEKIIINGVG